MSPEAQILATAAVAALAVAASGLLVWAVLRHTSLRVQLSVVAVVPVLGVLAGVLAVAQRMFISTHDLGVVTLVTLAGGAVAVMVALCFAAVLVRQSEVLQAGVRRAGLGHSVDVEPRGPREFRDLAAELERMQNRLVEADARERRVESSRRELISWVSHDLRTPLAGLRAMAEALEDGLAGDPDRYLSQMRVEVDRMSRMVDDLFELSRIHAGVLTVLPEVVALDDLVSDAIAASEPVATARGVQVSGRVESGLIVRADPSGLDRVLSNLVANGVRHTASGRSVEVCAEAVPGGIELSVTDGCGGIAEEDVARVFDVAWTGSEARPRQADGARLGGEAGLGLAIVKGIVEAHDGEVSLERHVQPAGAGAAGCRFLVRLPQEPADELAEELGGELGDGLADSGPRTGVSQPTSNRRSG